MKQSPPICNTCVSAGLDPAPHYRGADTNAHGNKYVEVYCDEAMATLFTVGTEVKDPQEHAETPPGCPFYGTQTVRIYAAGPKKAAIDRYADLLTMMNSPNITATLPSPSRKNCRCGSTTNTSSGAQGRGPGTLLMFDGWAYGRKSWIPKIQPKPKYLSQCA